MVIVLLKMEQPVLELGGYVESVSGRHVHFDLDEVGLARSLKDDDYPLDRRGRISQNHTFHLAAKYAEGVISKNHLPGRYYEHRNRHFKPAAKSI